MLGMATTARTRRLFLAALGFVYLVAFVSLGSQLHGLAGDSGVSPNRAFFEQVEAGGVGTLALPSLCRWLGGCSDTAFSSLVLAGVASAFALMSGVLPLLAALLCWFLYLSLFYAVQPFLGFQWDLLLLETGFLAIWLAPVKAVSWRSAAWRAPPPVAIWLCVRWLLFRLVFSSGVVKLTSGDGTWLALDAMAFHFETQPLPVGTSWWMHQLPAPVAAGMTAGTLLLEVLIPFAYWGPRRLRLLAGAATALLMLAIAATGNYGFFNLLTLVLCLSLIDDQDLPGRGFSVAPVAPRTGGLRAWRVGTFASIVLASWVVVASVLPLAGAFRLDLRESPLGALHDLQGGLRLVNGYGLFAHMTTERPEIVLEGSLDGAVWHAYEFSWKPGDPARAPSFLLLHMPRLDWQMWFAALRAPRVEPWLMELCARLLEGEPEVLALLASDPFEGRPPEFLRATLYDYRFTTREERAASGEWWVREELGRVVALRRSDLRVRPR
jgi:hypothetical protein